MAEGRKKLQCTFRLKKDVHPKLIEFCNVQSSITDTFLYLIEKEVATHGVRNLQEYIPAVRKIDFDTVERKVSIKVQNKEKKHELQWTFRLKNTVHPRVIDFYTSQSNIVDTLLYLIENEVKENGIRNLQEHIPSIRNLIDIEETKHEHEEILDDEAKIEIKVNDNVQPIYTKLPDTQVVCPIVEIPSEYED